MANAQQVTSAGRRVNDLGRIVSPSTVHCCCPVTVCPNVADGCNGCIACAATMVVSVSVPTGCAGGTYDVKQGWDGFEYITCRGNCEWEADYTASDNLNTPIVSCGGGAWNVSVKSLHCPRPGGGATTQQCTWAISSADLGSGCPYSFSGTDSTGHSDTFGDSNCGGAGIITLTV